MDAAILNIKNFSVSYVDSGITQALHDVSLTLLPGETLGIIGESGS